jgi:glycosyltransferase involved in cell wall biosynthesis
MRIAQLAPLWERVPPIAYGGTEAVVSLLADELASRGHEVVLYASGDSQSLAQLRSVYPRSLRTATELKDPSPYDWVHVATALKDHRRYDIIHNHAGELAMAMSSLISTPMLTTMHCLITPDTQFVWDHYQWFYNTISRSAKRGSPDRNYLGVVYNAIDVASFPYCGNKDDYLLFLSRIASEKGAHLAIEVAKRLGMKLILAGKVDRVDQQYFRTVVEPLIDGRLIHFFGEANAQQKRRLYAKARCLLMPLDWEEPFGLVMPEAMACGTPVIAFRRGAAPEIIVHGKTGFLVEDVEGMVQAVLQVDRIDPKRCRQHVAENFDVPLMADSYIALYERVLELSPLRPKVYAAPIPSLRPLVAEKVPSPAA